jgi:hypothetical protein
MPTVEQTKNRKRGHRGDPLIDALVEQTSKPRRTLLNAKYTVTAAGALGPGAAALPVKVQVELGRPLVLEGWQDACTDELAPAYLAGADATWQHTPEISQWLAGTGMADLLGEARSLLASPLLHLEISTRLQRKMGSLTDPSSHKTTSQNVRAPHSIPHQRIYGAGANDR